MILGPYGISGTLIGPVNREMDLNALRDHWEKNYPIRHFDGLPDFVEVTTGICHIHRTGEIDNVCSIARKCADVLSHLLCI